jgi:hypothetical protein
LNDFADVAGGVTPVAPRVASPRVEDRPLGIGRDGYVSTGHGESINTGPSTINPMISVGSRRQHTVVESLDRTAAADVVTA